MSTGIELCSKLRIHGNHLIRLLVCQLVPFLDLLSYPVAEWLADHSSADVDKPLLRDPRHVWRVRQVEIYALLLADELADVLESQVLVLWNVQSLDLVVLEILLFHGDDVLELEEEVRKTRRFRILTK